ncbi:DUF6056 family protein [Pontibacter burrus]|uniref:Glycosyltransferase RgtA/B/C/D-like domain-containing protein n=1 Tax=Pontibacter burrus TaxID=2704466 RepID=A0A6B3LX47_9BACT|nr:DUF6056 family protein [Pontibacter burrus]NEM98041.1 hypothetical protein [Pontibacter burrus]
MLPQENRTRNYSIIILITIGLYTLLPFLLLTQYTHPAADDFSFAERDTNLSFWAAQVKYYLNWSGRYFGTAIVRINPLTFDSLVAYKLYALVLLLLLSVAVYAIVRTVGQDTFNRKQTTGLAAMLLTLYILQLPSTSEGFYFFSTYATYQFPNILLLVLLIVLYRFFRAQNSAGRKLYTGLAILLCIAIVGSNEMALVITFTTVFVLATINLKHRLYRPYLILLLIVCIICCLVAVLAPGNFNRMTEHPNGGRLV